MVEKVWVGEVHTHTNNHKHTHTVTHTPLGSALKSCSFDHWKRGQQSALDGLLRHVARFLKSAAHLQDL